MARVVIALLVAAVQSWGAELSEVRLSTSTKLPQSRSVLQQKYDGAKKSLNTLERVQKAILDRDWSGCVRALAVARNAHPKVADWITLAELRCYLRLDTLSAEQTSGLNQAVRRALGRPEWLLRSPASADLKQELLRAQFVLVEASMKARPQDAWNRVDDLLENLDWMDADQKANALRLAGEAAFVRQRLTASKRFLERSLEIKEDEKVRARLRSVDVALNLATSEAEPTRQTPTEGKDEALEASEEEREIVERMRTALRSGEMLAAVEDGVDLIREFPWGARANWAADRIWESYEQIVRRQDPNLEHLKGKVIRLMGKVDAKRLSDWSTSAFRISQFRDSAELAELALKKANEQSNTTALRLLVARSHQALGKDKEARRHYQVLVDRHAGTPEARLALFQSGLLSFKLGENTSAAAAFERLLVLPGAEDMELDTRYWLWRSLQTVDQSRASSEAQRILTKFPFSYYGLRVRAEGAGGTVELPMIREKVKTGASLWLTSSERRSWERFQELSKGGWFAEAQAELERIPVPQDPKAMAMLSQAWAAAFGYPRAIGLINKAWDADAQFRGDPFFSSVFPKEFSSLIESESKRNELDPNWVRALIRQESAFNVLARSRSNALGLMQMIPPTAEEVARDLSWKNLKLPDDLLDPATNLKFCAYYLSKVLKQFGGHLPLALASYNAGPNRIGPWYQSRGRQMTMSSDPREEVWIDELPWPEPRFYVKAILRNLILYRVLDKGRVQLGDPIWKMANEGQQP